MSVWRDNWKHLRAPYQLTLSPIFLWGCFLARPLPAWRVAPAFVAFHLFLYTGITAYNSYYDRDEGAVGGLERPPTVHGSLLPFALALQTAGLLLGLTAGTAFAQIYLAFIVLGILYSHPRTRWKANPLLSVLVVGGGQGVLGFLAGWAAASGALAGAAGARGVLGTLSAAFTTLGLYPLTQLFQIGEDGKRGDRTLCVLLGAKSAIRLSQCLLVMGGMAAAVLAWLQLSPADALVLACGYSALLTCVRSLRGGRAAFRPVLRLSYFSAAGFAAFILTRLARW